MKLEDTLRNWLVGNRIALSVLGIGLALFVVTLLWNRGRHPDIADGLSRATCRDLYAKAGTPAESLAVDGEPAAVYRERKLGYLRPDVRCGEIRRYDSARGQ
jgi:hypothetical protein